MSRLFEFHVPEDPPELVIAERMEAMQRDLERIADELEGGE